MDWLEAVLRPVACAVGRYTPSVAGKCTKAAAAYELGGCGGCAKSAPQIGSVKPEECGTLDPRILSLGAFSSASPAAKAWPLQAWRAPVYSRSFVQRVGGRLGTCNLGGFAETGTEMVRLVKGRSR